MKRLLVCIGCLLLVTTVFIGCKADEAVPAETHVVGYQVTGTADWGSVTYQNEAGGTSQESMVVLPWTYFFVANEGDFTYISAQNMGDTGSITVEIYNEFGLIKTSSSSGAYVIASVSGTAL